MHFYRDKKQRVYLRYYDSEVGEGRTLPRDDSRHLDGLSNGRIREILDSEKEVVERPCPNHEAWKHVDRWLQYEIERRRDPHTVKEHRSQIERFVLQFFLGEMGGPKLEDWPKHTGKFYKWMVSKGRVVGSRREPATTSQIRLANISLRKFYRWLGEENLVTPVELLLRSPIIEDRGPRLPRPVSPEEVLQWAETCTITYVKFIGLMGYFFSLRPQEIFAAMRHDFRTGADIVSLECVKAMREGGLYHKLAFYVRRQKQNSGAVLDSAKKNRKDWVCCFDERAARAIYQIISPLQPDETVCKYNNRKLYENWAKHGIADLSIKDLRRASLHFLGHYSELRPMQLMKHARHKRIQTTLIYCKHPEESLVGESTISEDDL
jgi:hypothetical protein